MMNFAQDVIARSQEVPVLVDFWAPWCGPCRILGPTIEGLAAEAGGRWELVKVNTEEEEAIARQYQIMSIPEVKLFVKGQVVANFTGALSRSQIEAWLEEHLPDPRKAQLAALLDALQAGDEGARESLEALLMLHPDLVEGQIKLAALDTRSNPEVALARVADIRPGHKLADEAEDIRSLVEFMTCPLEGSETLVGKLTEARAAWAAGDDEATLQLLIDAVMIDKAFCNEMPRRATIAIFHYLGEAHPLTKRFRPFFSMALY